MKDLDKIKDLETIKEAIISFQEGTLVIKTGKKLNEFNNGYHKDLKISCDGIELFIIGKKSDTEYFSDDYTDEQRNFLYYYERLEGFADAVRTKTKFCFKTFRFKKVRYVKHDFWSGNCKTYLYKEEYWKTIEYRVNNWAITTI